MSNIATHEAMTAVERRAFQARVTMSEVCATAQVHQSVWSRAKARGGIRMSVLTRVEAAMQSIEAERVA